MSEPLDLELAAGHEPSLDELQAILGALGSGVLLAQADGYVVLRNRQAREFLGGPVTRLDELLPPGQHLDDTGTVELAPDDQRDRWLRITYRHLPDQSSMTVHFIDEMSAAEVGRRHRVAAIEHMAHELRTPVTSINVAATMLRANAGSEDPATRNELVDDIIDETDRLVSVVEAIVLLAELDDGAGLAREPVSLQQIVPQVVAGWSRQRPRTRIVLHELQPVPLVAGHETGVRHVVRALSSHAIRGTLCDEIRVEFGGRPDDGAAVRFFDERPRSDPSETQAMMQAWERADRSIDSTEKDLGLFAARRLVEAMNGRIWAIRDEAGHSELGFWLPSFTTVPDD